MPRKLILPLLLILACAPLEAETHTFDLDLNGKGFNTMVAAGASLELNLLNVNHSLDSYSVSIEDELLAKLKLDPFGAAKQLRGTPGTKVQGSPFTLVRCQKLTVHVDRAKDGDDAAKSWDFVFRTGRCGRWLTHYGFSFLPSEDESFFTRAVEANEDGEGGKFEILRQSDRSENDFEPTVAFTFQPGSKKGKKSIALGFTAGLGADIENRLVFAGLSFLIGDNVNLFVGAAGREQTRLKGIYEEGQLLGEDLVADQLTDKTFDISTIFGVGFRFDGNPFKKKDAGGDAK